MVVLAITLTVNGCITVFVPIGKAHLAAPRLAATTIAAVWSYLGLRETEAPLQNIEDVLGMLLECEDCSRALELQEMYVLRERDAVAAVK